MFTNSGVLGHQWPARRQVRKGRLIRFTKDFEIAVMLLAAAGFALQNVPLLLASIFLMGLQSTLFGPVKFAYLPQHLNERELTGGNGMVEMGTFVAILLGNVAGGLLIAVPQVGAQNVAATCVLLALAGRAAAQAVPVAYDPADPPRARGAADTAQPVGLVLLAHRRRRGHEAPAAPRPVQPRGADGGAGAAGGVGDAIEPARQSGRFVGGLRAG